MSHIKKLDYSLLSMVLEFNYTCVRLGQEAWQLHWLGIDWFVSIYFNFIVSLPANSRIGKRIPFSQRHTVRIGKGCGS